MSDQPDPTTEAELTALLDRLRTAWNAGDASAYADQFTEDVDYVTWMGQHTVGRATVREQHDWLFGGPLKGSTISIGDPAAGGTTRIRLLSPDVALIVGGSTGSHYTPSTPGEPGTTITLTAVRQPGAWRFSSFQNTRRVDPRTGNRPVAAG